MNGEKIQDPKEIIRILNVSANKNYTWFIFFLTFTFSILISTLNTTDLTLLLPEHGVKMPLINVELDLLDFFILSPVVLLLLHLNILFNHHKHLEKLYFYKDVVDGSSVDPSLYSFAFFMGNHYFLGRLTNLVLWILLYILPFLVFLIIYIRFADYHHAVITPLHLMIIIFDLIFIVAFINYNNDFYKSKGNDLFSSKMNTILRYIFYGIFMSTGYIMIYYFILFFYPITYKAYDPSYLEEIKTNPYHKKICKVIISRLSEHKDCYPRLTVTEEVLAKFSPDSLNVPRHLSMANIKEELKEQELILKYGKRIDLSNRNLRYADLQGNILTRADMTNSQFDAANLRGSHMQAVKLDNASFIDADLMEAKLQSTDFIRTNLHNTYLIKANMNQTTFTNCNLTDASLQRSQLKQVNFLDSNLVNVDFRNSKLVNTDFSGINLTGTSFHNANVTSSSFYKADLTASDLSGIHFVKRDDSTIPYFRKAKMFGVNISKDKLQDINLTTCQKQFIFDVNVSEEHLTFDGRRVKYLHTVIQQIDAQKPMTNCKSQEETQEKLIKLQDILNTSCKHLKNEASIYGIREDIKNIYNELMRICSH